MKAPEALRIGMLSLGCPKNLVDSEVMLGILRGKDYRLTQDVTHCDVALVNTCAFIEEAREESIDSILELAELKKKGKIQRLIVCGCLPQRYYQALQEQIAEIDALVGTGEYGEIAAIVEGVLSGKRMTRVEDTRFVYDHSHPRYSLTPAHYRYIKVGEGCNHRCSFCIIPKLRGDYRSRSIPSIVEEAKKWVDEGMIELNLISQDTSFYGWDLDGQYHLPDLLEELNKVQGLRWIRLLYNHPFHMSDAIISAVASLEKVCKYVDLPLQHATDRMLKLMKRGMNKAKTSSLIERMRTQIPGVVIRTTFIVGFPGEADRDFEELLDFVKSMRFDRVGVFAYSRGDDPASEFEEQVPPVVKNQRKDRLMRLQQEISRENNQKWIGKTIEVLVEGKGDQGFLYKGRTYMDAPEIDGTVAIRVPSGVDLRIGSLVPVRIFETSEYDLAGECLPNGSLQGCRG